MTVVFKNRLAPQTNAASQIKVMGIDPSTFTGIAVLRGDLLLQAKTITFPETKGYVRLQLIADAIRAVVESEDPDVILIERPISSGKFNNEIQSQIGTLIRDRIFTLEHKWYDVSPTTLKKWTSGSGKADKKQMAKAVASRWGYVNKDDNIIDAYALARLAQFTGTNPVNIKGVY